MVEDTDVQVGKIISVRSGVFQITELIRPGLKPPDPRHFHPAATDPVTAHAVYLEIGRTDLTGFQMIPVSCLW